MDQTTSRKFQKDQSGKQIDPTRNVEASRRPVQNVSIEIDERCVRRHRQIFSKREELQDQAQRCACKIATLFQLLFQGHQKKGGLWQQGAFLADQGNSALKGGC